VRNPKSAMGIALGCGILIGTLATGGYSRSNVWSLGSQSHALACHVTIADIPPSESECILVKLNHVLRDHFNIHHSTIQFEHQGCPELEGCVVPIEDMSSTAAHSHHGHAH